MDPPIFIILAGPNGAGKSTAASRLLHPGIAFVNADDIARTLPNAPSGAADIEAGRIALEMMGDLERMRADFAVETTLASRSLAARGRRLKSAGYFLRLIFVWSPGPEFSIDRVASRVRKGGHHIPEETIRRRYEAGLKNFFELYRPIADAWEMYENTSKAGFRMIASGEAGGSTTIFDPVLWTLASGGRDHA